MCIFTNIVSGECGRNMELDKSEDTVYALSTAAVNLVWISVQKSVTISRSLWCSNVWCMAYQWRGADLDPSNVLLLDWFAI